MMSMTFVVVVVVSNEHWDKVNFKPQQDVNLDIFNQNPFFNFFFINYNQTETEEI